MQKVLDFSVYMTTMGTRCNANDITQGQHKMTNYQAMAQRINKANTIEALAKVETSLDRIFDNGIFTINEYSKLNQKITDKWINIELND